MIFTHEEYYTMAMALNGDLDDAKFTLGVIMENIDNIPNDWLITLFYICPSSIDRPLRYYTYERLGYRASQLIVLVPGVYDQNEDRHSMNERTPENAAKIEVIYDNVVKHLKIKPYPKC